MFEYLEKSLKEKVATLAFIRVNPIWEEFKSNSRFNDLIEKAFKNADSEVLKSLSPKKYEKSGLNEDIAKKLLTCLKNHMKDEKPFLDNDLSLKQLAEQIDISGNQLSQLLNEYLQQNFYDFVNTYRLEDFKERVKDPKNRNFTLLSIAYQCGFNSKTTFNTFFKKLTGQTPSEYYKSV